MSSNMITITLYIENMTCVNCENIIERKLSEAPGIVSVKASYSKGTAVITYDANVIDYEKMKKILEEEDYYVREDNNGNPVAQIGNASGTNNSSQKTADQNKYRSTGQNKSDLLGIVIIIFAMYLIARRFGLLNIFNSFPVAKDGMGYGMLFLIGLLTSVHCVAMCGGICLSQCVPKKEGSFTSRFSAIRPSLLYNTGRVISYTIIGGIVGGIGSVVSFSGTMKGIVQILAGVFMVIMGLNMLNVFPWLRKLNPRMPKIFAKKIYENRNSKSPLIIGIFNGLMPCGPLQAMQLYALSTGSPIKGALSMFLFSTGTVPLLFAFGALSSFLSKKFTTKMMTASATLVVFLGIFMFGNGMSLSGIVLPTFPAMANTSQEANVATLQGDVQVVTSGIASGSYEPIIVQKGIPVQWTLKAEDGDINGCNNSIIIQKYGIQKKLELGDNLIEFTPEESGNIPFSCWMGMIRSNITVVDDLSKVDNSVIDNAQSNTVTSSGSCCSGGSYSGSTNNSDSNSDTNSGTNSSTNSGITDNNLLEVQIPTDEVAVATVKEDGTQEVEITYSENGISPAVVIVQSGLETVWNIKGDSEDGSFSNLLFPYYGAQLEVFSGDNPIQFVPDLDFDFFTSDSKYYAYVKVVEDIKNINLEAIKKEVSEYSPSDNSGYTRGVGACH